MINKNDLPRKDCVYCRREMVWRKSWAKNWEEVKFCSARCAKEAKAKRSRTEQNFAPMMRGQKPTITPKKD